MRALVRITGFDHLVLRTPDPDRLLGFYVGVLGLEPVRVDEWRRGEVPFPSVRIDGCTIIDLLRGERSGSNMDHLCLVLADDTLDEIADDARLEVISGPTPGLFGAQGLARALYVRDPDGNVVELRHYPPA